MVEVAGLSLEGAGVVTIAINVGGAGVAGVVGVAEVGVVVVVAEVGGFVGLAGVEPFASFEHVRPQYGWTLVPSLNFGFFLQCYENRVR